MALESFAGRRVSIVVLGACTVLAACASIGPKHRTALTAEAALQVAAEAEAAGNNELAMSMYAEAAAREPGNVELQLRCADALARSGKISQARQLITERLHARPGDPELMRALALIDLITGESKQAITGLDRVLATNPGDLRALVDKAIALDLEGQHIAAQSIYREVLVREPNDPATINDLAVSLMLEGRTGQALETLASLQQTDNLPQRVKVNLGLLYAATGHPEQSRQLLGDRVKDNDLSALARALVASAGESPHPQ
jgi:Flp pilus assembly protein TadD